MPQPSEHVHDWVRHSAYSDPGPYAGLLRELPHEVGAVCAAARNVIGHYRAELPDLAQERWAEIDSRWLERILATDQARHRGGLLEPRELVERVAGCCRDHTLLVVGALREQGVPARSRVGFAGYFTPTWHHDHVVVEHWDGTRWVRTDPELDGEGYDFDVRDLPTGPGSPFETAAEVWRGHREGRIDTRSYGVVPDTELCGPEFVRGYVIFEVAHRFGDELLLWDTWGAAGPEADPAGADRLADEVAELLVAGDAGDRGAEAELTARYRSDERLHPAGRVVQLSPYGLPPVEVDLVAERPRGSRAGAGGATAPR